MLFYRYPVSRDLYNTGENDYLQSRTPLIYSIIREYSKRYVYLKNCDNINVNIDFSSFDCLYT